MDRFEQAYQAHGRAVWLFLQARLPFQVVEDVFQEVWVRLGQQSSWPENERAWLLRTARNLAYDHYRRKARDQAALQRLQQQAQATGEADQTLVDLAHGPLRRALQECQQRLSPRQQQVVGLRLRGESYARIAAQLSISANAAQQHWHQGKQRLAQCVQQRLAQEDLAALR